MSESESPPPSEPPPAWNSGHDADESEYAPVPQGADAPAPDGGPGARNPRAGSPRALALAVGLAVVVAGVTMYFVARSPEPKDDLGRFQGTWKLAPDGREKRFPINVRVTGDRWVYMVADKEQKKYRIAVRPEAEPKEIDLTQLGPDDQPSAFVLRGIYAFEDGIVKVVAAPDPLPRPTAFDAPDGPPVWVLERP